MDITGTEVSTVELDDLKNQTRQYVEACNGFISDRIHDKWDERRVDVEEQLLSNLFEAYQCIKGDYEIDFPEFQHSRWNKKLNDNLSSRHQISEFLRVRAIPTKDLYTNRIKGLGSYLTFKDPSSTLVSIGGGNEIIDDTPFHKNVVLLDPLYVTDENISARIHGYREIPLPYSADVLKSLGSKTLGIELNFSLHHLEEPLKVLEGMFKMGNVRGIIISDYDIPMSSLGLQFILANMATLFPLAAEMYELRDLGLAKFINMHSHGGLNNYLNLAKKYGFQIQDLDFYPRLDSSLDNTDGLNESEKKYLERGSKFAVTFTK